MLLRYGYTNTVPF